MSAARRLRWARPGPRRRATCPRSSQRRSPRSRRWRCSARSSASGWCSGSPPPAAARAGGRGVRPAERGGARRAQGAVRGPPPQGGGAGGERGALTARGAQGQRDQAGAQRAAGAARGGRLWPRCGGDGRAARSPAASPRRAGTVFGDGDALSDAEEACVLEGDAGGSADPEVSAEAASRDELDAVAAPVLAHVETVVEGLQNAIRSGARWSACCAGCGRTWARRR